MNERPFPTIRDIWDAVDPTWFDARRLFVEAVAELKAFERVSLGGFDVELVREIMGDFFVSSGDMSESANLDAESSEFEQVMGILLTLKESLLGRAVLAEDPKRDVVMAKWFDECYRRLRWALGAVFDDHIPSMTYERDMFVDRVVVKRFVDEQPDEPDPVTLTKWRRVAGVVNDDGSFDERSTNQRLFDELRYRLMDCGECDDSDDVFEMWKGA